MTENRESSTWVFNLHDLSQGIRRQLGDGISTRIFVGEQAMLSVVTIEPNAAGTVHSHPQEQWGVLLEGECVRIQGGEEIPMKAGDFWHTPGGVPHGIRTGSSRAVVLDIFAPPRDEYRKSGSGFGEAAVRD
ncbi:MAG: cupin domain-containing protein [Gammaproteobacteria bacterium]|nr:cupin domain-containing protein [Gammaproteobacteria bacterium]